MIVSHDREFLARTVNRVVELDLTQRSVGVYQGGYQAYLAEREISRQHARQAYEQYADSVEDLRATARTQRAWMAKGVRNARRAAPTRTARDKVRPPHRRAAPAQLLQHAQRRRELDAPTPVAAGQQHPEAAHLGERLDQVERQPPALVDLLSTAGDRRGQVPHGVEQRRARQCGLFDRHGSISYW